MSCDNCGGLLDSSFTKKTEEKKPCAKQEVANKLQKYKLMRIAAQLHEPLFPAKHLALQELIAAHRQGAIPAGLVPALEEFLLVKDMQATKDSFLQQIAKTMEEQILLDFAVGKA